MISLNSLSTYSIVLTVASLLWSGCTTEPKTAQPLITMHKREVVTSAAQDARANLNARTPLQPTGGSLLFDPKSSPFSDYDLSLVKTIEQRWLQLLPPAITRTTGVVTVDFKLNHKGEVSDLKAVGETVGESLVQICKQAVADTAPFAPWPTDMRLAIGGRRREIRFRFYYR